ncbi:MAG: hypothetical protein V1787_06425 [Candidatus Micrarchaeota archaeon]
MRFSVLSLAAILSVSLLAGQASGAGGTYKCTDVYGNGVTDPTDFAFFGQHYGSCVGGAKYDSRADFEADGCVDKVDFEIFKQYYQGGRGVPNAPNFYCINAGTQVQRKCPDVTRDNEVSAADFSVFVRSYNKCSGTAGFDSRTDFDSNGCVNDADKEILAKYLHNPYLNAPYCSFPPRAPAPRATPAPTTRATGSPYSPPLALEPQKCFAGSKFLGDGTYFFCVNSLAKSNNGFSLKVTGIEPPLANRPHVTVSLEIVSPAGVSVKRLDTFAGDGQLAVAEAANLKVQILDADTAAGGQPSWAQIIVSSGVSAICPLGECAGISCDPATGKCEPSEAGALGCVEIDADTLKCTGLEVPCTGAERDSCEFDARLDALTCPSDYYEFSQRTTTSSAACKWSAGSCRDGETAPFSYVSERYCKRSESAAPQAPTPTSGPGWSDPLLGTPDERSQATIRRLNALGEDAEEEEALLVEYQRLQKENRASEANNLYPDFAESFSVKAARAAQRYAWFFMLLLAALVCTLTYFASGSERREDVAKWLSQAGPQARKIIGYLKKLNPPE